MRLATAHQPQYELPLALDNTAPGGRLFEFTVNAMTAAPSGAQLLSAKVCGGEGFCADSAILAGMHWAVEQGAKVINMSLGGSDTPEQDPLESAVESLTASSGVLFVISAGNPGGERTIGSPGSATSALTVGAVSKSDTLADFSSRGPRKGDEAIGLGLLRRPHTDDQPLDRTVTYRNTGDPDLTLQLRLQGIAPAGVFKLSATTLTVPDKGSASVVLTAGTRGSVPVGRYTGRLVATAGASRVGMPIAARRRPSGTT